MSPKRHSKDLPVSQAPKIGFESYVDIATNMVMHDADLERLKALESNERTTSERASKHIDNQCPNQLSWSGEGELEMAGGFSRWRTTD